jgi:ribosomal protein L18
MVNKADKNVARLRRHRRVRGKISGTAARPRLDVFRSAKHIYAQVIDDEQGVTLASASSMDKISTLTAATSKLLRRLARTSPRSASRRASLRSSTIVAASFTTAVCRLSLRVPARPV